MDIILILLSMLLIFVLGIVIALVVSRTKEKERIKYSDFLSEHSLAIKKLKKVNEEYKLYEFKPRCYEHSYDNENFYNEIACIDYLIYKLQFDKREVLDEINKTHYNKTHYNAYLEEVNKIKTFGLYSDIPGNLRQEKLLKYEEIMFDEKIQRITPIYMIKVKLIDTNLNGYQKTSKIKIFGEDIVKNLINELNKRNGTFYLNKEIWNAICRVERGRVSNKMRFYILERDHYRCRCCGRSQNEVELEIDHIVPIAKGGKSTLDNLQTLCAECNKRKGTTIHRY